MRLFMQEHKTAHAIYLREQGVQWRMIMKKNITVMMKRRTLMNASEFQELLEHRLAKIEAILGAKGKEYSSENDRLHNFKTAARIDNETPEESLWGMAKKHLVSIMDIISALPYCPSIALMDEKIGDMINYLILLEALLIERISNGTVDDRNKNCADKQFFPESAQSDNGITEDDSAVPKRTELIKRGNEPLKRECWFTEAQL
jgi:hypothetical protein